MKSVKALMAIPMLAACCAMAAPSSSFRCVIEPDRTADIGTPVIGVIESVRVERGDYVREGALLAQLRASVERASVTAAEVRAQADADLLAATVNYDFQRQKLA